MKHHNLVLSILLSFFVFSAQAEPEVISKIESELESKPSSKLYITAGLGYADTGWDYADYDSTGVGLNIMLGYHYSPNWSFETGYMLFPTSTKTNSSIDTNAFSLLAKYRLPIDTTNLAFFGKAGIGYVFNNGTSSDSTLALAFGYGVDYLVKPNFLVEGQYLHYVGQYQNNPIPNIDYASVGFTYLIPRKWID